MLSAVSRYFSPSHLSVEEEENKNFIDGMKGLAYSAIFGGLSYGLHKSLQISDSGSEYIALPATLLMAIAAMGSFNHGIDCLNKRVTRV